MLLLETLLGALVLLSMCIPHCSDIVIVVDTDVVQYVIVVSSLPLPLSFRFGFGFRGSML